MDTQKTKNLKTRNESRPKNCKKINMKSEKAMSDKNWTSPHAVTCPPQEASEQSKSDKRAQKKKDEKKLIRSGKALPSATLRYIIKLLEEPGPIRVAKISGSQRPNMIPPKRSVKVTPAALYEDRGELTPTEVEGETAISLTYAENQEMLWRDFYRSFHIDGGPAKTVSALLEKINKGGRWDCRTAFRSYLVAVVFPERIGTGTRGFKLTERVYPMALVPVSLNVGATSTTWSIRTVQRLVDYFPECGFVPDIENLVGVDIKDLLCHALRWKVYGMTKAPSLIEDKWIEKSVLKALDTALVCPMVSIESVSSAVWGTYRRLQHGVTFNGWIPGISQVIPSSRVLKST